MPSMRNHYINVVASCLCFPRLTMRSLARGEGNVAKNADRIAQKMHWPLHKANCYGGPDFA